MRIKLILSLTGTILAFFGLSFILPIIVGLYMGEQYMNIFWMFGLPMFISLSLGTFLHNYFHCPEFLAQITSILGKTHTLERKE